MCIRDRPIVLLNKRDKGHVVTKEEIEEKIKGAFVIESAVSEGIGIAELADRIEYLVYGGKVSHKDSLMAVSYTHLSY